MARKKLKLYVWEKVLCDYTCGMAFAIAHDLSEARKVASQQGVRLRCFGQSEKEAMRDPDYIHEDIHDKPDIYDIAPIGFAVCGGG